jgi:uncharacterized protein
MRATPPNRASDLQTSCVGVGWRQPHYGQILQELPPLDFLEVHTENFFAEGGAALSVLERGRTHYPISLHGVGLSLGSALGVDQWHLQQLRSLVRRIEPVRVSDHAAFARGVLGAATVHAADLLPLPFSPEALVVLCANVQQVQDSLQRPLAVENLSAYLSWTTPEAKDALTEADFLQQLCRRTGCQLLVDVNNLYVNALNAQLLGLTDDPFSECQKWLSAIDPDCVAEVHLAGHCRVRRGDAVQVIDDHGSRVHADVWGLYSYALGLWGSVPTLIEWDTEVPELSVLLDEATHARRLAASAQVLA